MVPTYASFADFPSAVPVFPLAGALLLPRVVLPLNIFEPRYLAMVDEAIRTDRLIGIIQPFGDGGTTGSPLGRTVPLRRVGCVGRIKAYQEFDDGRLMIALKGLCRFTPKQEIATERAFRTFAVDWQPFGEDLDRRSGEAGIEPALLASLVKNYASLRGLARYWKDLSRGDPEDIINGIAYLGTFSPEEKQALLEAPSLRERAEMLSALAEMDIAGGPDGGSQRLQ